MHGCIYIVSPLFSLPVLVSVQCRITAPLRRLRAPRAVGHRPVVGLAHDPVILAVNGGVAGATPVWTVSGHRRSSPAWRRIFQPG